MCLCIFICDPVRRRNIASTKIAILHLKIHIQNGSAYLKPLLLCLCPFSYIYSALRVCSVLTLSLSLPLSQSLRVCACCILVYSCVDMKRIQEKRNGGKSISTLRALFLCCQVCQDYFVLWIHVQYGIHRCVYGSENIGEMYESMGSTVYCVHVSLFSFVDGMQ